jgi:mevalonate kinase
MKKNTIIASKQDVISATKAASERAINKTINQFFAHGKLLLTGEYFVMIGAKSLALPLRYGQTLTVHKTASKGILMWNALQYNKVWFSCTFQLSDLSVLETTDIQISARLQSILKAAKKLNTSFLNTPQGYKITTNLNFNREWGLGTSSTLLANIAQWAEVNVYSLHWSVSDGSAYDIACSREVTPLIYTVEDKKPFVRVLSYNPPFKDNIYFVYQGNKQDTANSIKRFDRDKQKYASEVSRISEITEAFVNASSIEQAASLIDEHEHIVSLALGSLPVKETLFTDFPGTVKSLGAWGGDFIMAISNAPKPQVYSYFRKRGLITVFTFAEMLPV